MQLSRGARLGPYEVVHLLGAGGMGEVYRARDPRLGRDVALKVLPSEVARDADRIRRFQRESRAVAAISHPNILAIHDVGVQEGIAYSVMELLDGRTLREELSDRRPGIRRVVEIGAAVSRGLAAAHARGIVHRDLKPENIFVTRDGQVKVLDFGLASVTTEPEGEGNSGSPTLPLLTKPGAILGTVGYMSPEQVRGRAVDVRSDVFSLGVVLHEMMFGCHPFPGESAADVAGAILNADPTRPDHPPPDLPAALPRIVWRCLEKAPADRFQAVFDVGLALEAVVEREERARRDTAGSRRRAALRWLLPMLAALAVAVAGITLTSRARRPEPPSIPSFERITFHRGFVHSARFAPDGRTVVYAARWGEKPSEVFVQRLGSPDARSLGRADAVLGVVGNEVILRHGAPPVLARVPLEGGAPRDVLDAVIAADWTRDGGTSFAVREVEGRQQLEWPIGQIRYQTAGFGQIRSPRLSPAGDMIAFIDNQGGNVASYGDIVVLDASGRRRVLSPGWDDAGGLAWSPDGREIWFTAARGGMNRALHAVTLSGAERPVARVATTLVLQDVAPDGRLLVAHGQMRSEVRGRLAGDVEERDLSWLDGSIIPRLSPDGTQMVFEECWEGGGVLGSVYLRRTDGTSPVRLGTGEPLDVSPDWTRVLARTGYRYPDNGLHVIPLGAGDPVPVPRGSIHDYMWAYWHPDGERLLIVGNEEGQPVRVFVQTLPAGLPKLLVPQPGTGCDGRPISPDGRFFLTRDDEGASWTLYPLDGSGVQRVPGLNPDDVTCGWTRDGRFLFAVEGGFAFPARVVRIELATGIREPWLILSPPDRAGVHYLYSCDVSADGRCYAYGYERRLSDLYLVDGLR